MDSLQSLGPLAEWVRGTAPEPIDKQAACLKILDFLYDEELIISSQPNWGSRMIKLLEETDLSQVPMTKTAWEVYRNLFCTSFHLFPKPSPEMPMTQVIVKHIVRSIPKNHLMLSSEMFRQVLITGGRSIVVNTDVHDESIIMAFLTYLETGNIQISLKNAIGLLELARQTTTLDLEADVTDFLEQNLEYHTQACSIPILLDWAIKHQRQALIYLSLRASRNPIIERDPALNINSTIAMLVRHVRFLTDTFSGAFVNEQLSLIGHSPNIFNGQYLAIVNEFCKIVPVHLLLSTPDLTDERLEFIISHLPDLKHLSIHHSRITKIPHAEQFQMLNCFGCMNLLSLTVPIAERLYCENCTNLTDLTAPLAALIQVYGCTNLRRLSAPQVKELYCDNPIQTASQTFEFPLYATISFYDGCQRQSSIDDPATTA